MLYHTGRESDISDFSDLDNLNHDPEIDILPKVPTGKKYTKFQIDTCRTFLIPLFAITQGHQTIRNQRALAPAITTVALGMSWRHM